VQPTEDLTNSDEGLALYWAPGACARIPFVALEEIGAPFELKVVNRYRGEAESDEFRTVNPKLKLPALVIGDFVVTENPVILRTLDRHFPAAGLLPRGDERLQIEVDSTMAWFASDLHAAVARHRFPILVSPAESTWEEVRLKARSELEGAFAILEKRLAGREWLFGEWSIVDVYMLWIWFRAIGSGMSPIPFQRCAEVADRCQRRPSVARVLDREEEVFDRFIAESWIPPSMPPHQVGRVPVGLET
jgi:glutathione S-transferase